jgi:hypothetical protein
VGVFSKRASSPTKLGEMLGLGLPVIMNAGVGDGDWIANKFPIGEVLNQLNSAEYQRVSGRLEAIAALDKQPIRQAAEEYFSLSLGVETYVKIYRKLCHS